MRLPISIWSDIACPWCFVGKANLDEALRILADDAPEIECDIRWRAFELDPRPREPSTMNYVERLAGKYQRSLEEAQAMIDNMTAAIEAVGGEAHFEKVIAANTFDAHRLIQWAGTISDQQHALTAAFMHGYLATGINLGLENDLLAVVESAGLDSAAARQVLNSDQFGAEVRGDEAEAQKAGIQGVPFFKIGHFGISGAQPPATLVAAIHQAQADRGPGLA